MEPTTSHKHYEISVWTDDHRSPELRRSWQSFASSRESATAIYQSPEYFDYLQAIERDGRCEILTVKDSRTGTLVGIIPIRMSVYRLQYTLGSRTLIGVRLKSIGILGSEPLIPQDPAAFDELFVAIAHLYPESQVIYMDTVPSTSYLWHHLQTSTAIKGLYRTLVIGGFREWHSIRLPKSMEEYYKKLPRKKRYNLMRQERQLQEHCKDPLHLFTVKKEEDLPILFDAIEKLPTGKYDFVFRKEEYVHLARYGLLHCYVLKSGRNVIGLLLGIRAGAALRIDRLAHDPSLERFSPGTTLWQSVLRDMIGSGEFTTADFGYGLPAYRHRSTNDIEQKGRILLFRRSVANSCLIFTYSCYSSAVHFIRNKTRRVSRRRPASDGQNEGMRQGPQAGI
jgi:CelD/BcsL family acetyltransferase involved in cellulose biosynthesis